MEPVQPHARGATGEAGPRRSRAKAPADATVLQVLAQGEFEDLFEVGKLFAPHEEE